MFIFSEEKRPKLQQERPDLSDSELTRLLARMWNELPDKKKVGRKTCTEGRKGGRAFAQLMSVCFRRNINGLKSS